MIEHDCKSVIHNLHMKIAVFASLVFIGWAHIGSGVKAATKARQPLSIAHFQSYHFNIPESLLEEIRLAGYKYVSMGIDFASEQVTTKNDWGNGDPDGTYNPVNCKTTPLRCGTLFSKLKEEFRKAASHGLRLIPRVAIGNKWSSHWERTNNTIEDSNWNYIDEYEYKLLPDTGSDDLGEVGSTTELLPVDVNGDGKTEVMQLRDNDGQLGLYVYSLVNNRYEESWTNENLGGAGAHDFITADVDNDGRTDLLQIWDHDGRLGLEVYMSDGTGYHTVWSNTWPTTNVDLGGLAETDKLLTADVNGDGRTDLLQVWDYGGRLGLEVHMSDGTGYYTAWSNIWTTTNVNLGGVSGTDKFLTADVNDDGRTDLLQVWDIESTGKKGLEVLISDGTGYFTAWSNTWTNLGLGGYGAIKYLTADTNADCKTDLLQLWDNNGRLAIEVFASDGTGYYPVWSSTWEESPLGYVNLGGSGAIDYLLANVNDNDASANCNDNDASYPDLLHLYQDGHNLGLVIDLGGNASFTTAWAGLEFQEDDLELNGNPVKTTVGADAIRFLPANIDDDDNSEFLRLWDNNGKLAVDVFDPFFKQTKVPPFAECKPEPDQLPPCGLDLSFKSYLEVVHSAFNDAKKDNPEQFASWDHLDYIDLSHDEMYTPASFDIVMGTTSQLDQDYIRDNGDNADAYYKLIADEIIRRVEAVKDVFDGMTRVLINADMFNREHNGGRAYDVEHPDNRKELDGWGNMYAWSSIGPRSVKLNVKHVLPLLLPVKDDIILVPWQYGPRNNDTGHVYSVDNTLNCLTNLVCPGVDFSQSPNASLSEDGFDVIAAIAYEDWIGAAGVSDGRQMLENWVNGIGQRWRDNPSLVGYEAYTWDNPHWDDSLPHIEQQKQKRFWVFPELAKRAGFYPLNDLVSFNVNQEISVTVPQYRLERIFGLSNDPYLVVNINSQGEQHSKTAENAREGSTVVPSPNVFRQSMDPATISNGVIPVDLAIRDRDVVGGDDPIDINPAGNETDLRVLYDMNTGTTVPPSPQSGDDSISRAKIHYQIGSRRSGSLAQTPDCDKGFDGTFSFDTTLTNTSAVNLQDIKVNIASLTRGNALRVDDGFLEEQEAFYVYPSSDESLVPGDSEMIPFTVCLQHQTPFELYVDVAGRVEPWQIGGQVDK